MRQETKEGADEGGSPVGGEKGRRINSANDDDATSQPLGERRGILVAARSTRSA